MAESDKIPTVSVVMPVYNGERTLKQAIESVLAQTFRNFEMIVCNDASTDSTAQILERFDDARVRAVHNTSNLGEGPSRDRAIALARGNMLAVIDADDAWAPDRLTNLLAATVPSKDRMIIDDIMECHDTPAGMVPWRKLRGKHAFGSNGTTAIDVPIEHFVCLKRLLIKPLIPLSWFKQHDFRHSSRQFAADTEFFLKLMARGLQPRYVPAAMYYYRITPGSMSGYSNRSRLMREVLEDAVTDFRHSPAVQEALRKKIAMVAREEQYLPFVRKLKDKRLGEALRMARRAPWFIPEFLRRSGETFAYHAHRIRHGGRTRGIR